MKSRDAFTVTLIGADGSGKTSVVYRLPEALSHPCKIIYMGVSTSSSNRMLPTTRLYHAWKRASNPNHANQGPPDPNRQHKRPRSLPKRIIKDLRHSAHYMILFSEEWYRQLLSWWWLHRGQILLYDRHFFIDYYAYDINRPRTFWQRVHGRMLMRWYPRPQLVIFLDAPAEVLFARKGEGTLELLEHRRQDYLALREVLPDFVIVDATLPLDQVMDNVIRVIESYEQKRT
jgi:thymidylate kinase